MSNFDKPPCTQLLSIVAFCSILMAAIPCAFAQAELLITEINYHPDEGVAADENEGEKFIEIKNVGDDVANTADYEVDGIGDVTYSQMTIAPGGFLLIAKNSGAFASKYGFAPGATFAGKLSAKGDKLEIIELATMDTVFEVSYWDGDENDGETDEEKEEQTERPLWPSNPDGDDTGYTLVPFLPNSSADPDDYRNWRPSISSTGGSPGADEPITESRQIFINEVRARDAVDPNADNDAVELYNPSSEAVNISDWFLTDNLDDPKRFPLDHVGDGLEVPANGYLVLENDVDGFVLRLSSRGERIFLYSGDSGGNLTGYVAGLFFGGSADGGVTFSRHINSVGAEQFPASPITLGGVNDDPQVGPVVITEIMYNPELSGSPDEFIEIVNTSDQPVALYDAASNLNWRIEGVNYQLPGNQPTLPAGGIALITPTSEAEFRMAHPGVPVGVQIFGPWTVDSGLSNGGEEVALQRYEILPGEDSTDPDIGELDRRRLINVDVVFYDNKSPWPTEAAGLGRSLVRSDRSAYGNDPANWQASLLIGGTPGTIYDYTGPQIIMNEVLAHTDAPQTDVIELYNPTDDPVDISGWFLTDDIDDFDKYKIPPGKVIPAHGYWAVNEDNDANPNTTPPPSYFGGAFQISSRGDEVYLYSADGDGNPTGHRHGWKFRATVNGQAGPIDLTLGRHIDSFGREHFTKQERSVQVLASTSNPAGAENNPPEVGPVVFTEINFAPESGDVEFIEIKNISGSTVPLYDTSAGGEPNNTWEIEGVTFAFPTPIPSLPAGAVGVILPVGTDVAAFRAANNVPDEPEAYVWGGADGYLGALNNGGEELALVRPDNPDDLGGGVIFVPKIAVDVINYRDSTFWPDTLVGVPLEKFNLSGFSDDPVYWRAAAAVGGTPGTTPDGLTYDTWAASNFTVDELADPALSDCDGNVNGDDYENIFAYGFGYDPHITPGGDLLPQVATVNVGGADYVGISFRRQIEAIDLGYAVEMSDDLTGWAAATVEQVGLPVDNGDGTETVTFRTTVSTTETSRLFLRVKLTKL